MFHGAINFDLTSFRLQFSEFGKQVRRSNLKEDPYAMAPYRLYFINNRYFFEEAAEDLIGLANFLQDLGGKYNQGYYDYQNRWAQNPSDHGSLEGNTLQEVLVNKINNQFSKPSITDSWEVKPDRDYIFNYYLQWAEQAFIPNNFLGYFRLIIKQYSVRFYREWYLNKEDYGNEKLYQEISEIFSKVLEWYRNEKPLLRFREHYDPKTFNEVMIEYQHLADVLSLYKEVWFRGTPGYPTGENPVPTPESMNEALFELGMDDSLPDWDYEICPKCDNKGVFNNRRCSKCKGFGYLADQRIYPLKYAGSFSTGEQRSMNRESAWPIRRFTVRDNLSLPTSERLRELASRAKL